MAEQIYFEDVQEGQALPTLVKNPTTQQLVQWAAGSGDFYQIHYDPNFAKANNLAGIIVHGALKNAFLGQLVWEFAGHQGKVRNYSCSYRGMDVPGQEERIRGVVKRKYQEGQENLVELEIWLENEAGQKTTPGGAVVALPARH